MRSDIASSSAAGPREASLASASFPPGAEHVVVVLDRLYDLRRPLLRRPVGPRRRVHVPPVDLAGVVQHVRVHARRDEVQHADPGALQLAPERLAEGHDAGLGRGVGGGRREVA